MNGKTFFTIALIAVATFAGVIFVDAKMKPGSVLPAPQVRTYGNSINNPIRVNKANPGNIRDSVQTFEGEIDSPNSDFKSFSSMAYGYRAMIVILRTYYNKYNLHSLAEMISRWAPPEDDNDTQGYIDFVASNGDIDPEQDLGTVLFGGYNDTMKNLLTCMTWMEQGISFVVDEQDIRQAFILA